MAAEHSNRKEIMDNGLFIRGLKFNRNKVENFDEYPFNIPVIHELSELKFNKPITFLVGENGSGKSTLIEALAVCIGLSAEGGTRNMVYETLNTTSCLHDYLTLIKSGMMPKWKFFLRAESFYTMANDYERYGRGSWHNQSHGEAFLDMIESFSAGGLYLMDEPESALSPKNLMRLLAIINNHAKYGTQMIIATHSPILLSYIDGEILDVNNKLNPIKFRDTDIYQTYKHFLDCPEKMQRFLFQD